MGYRHSPTQYGGEGGVCFASGRAASPVAERREVARSGASSARGPVAALFLALLRVYQGCLSPLMPSACKFYPSCSHYAYHAIELHGARRGGWLALLRLLRCRPFSPGGYDPAPTRELDFEGPAGDPASAAGGTQS